MARRLCVRPPLRCFSQDHGGVAAVLRVAGQQRVPVVTRGSGTGLSGGSLPVPDCIVLCLVKMDRILELDEKNLTILVETGVITQKIAELADTAGLFYPPDPGSMKISTIGGNVAENSGGLRGLKYGITRDYVMGLEVVLAMANRLAGQQVRQGRGRLFDEGRVHRHRRHAGRHHQGSAQTGAEAAQPKRRCSRRYARWMPPRKRSRRSSPPRSFPAPWSFWTG